MKTKKLTVLALSMMFGLSVLTSCQGESNSIKSINVYNPDVIYLVGEEFSPTKIHVVYEDGREELVDVTNDMVSGFSTVSQGQKTVFIKYKGVSTSFVIKVVEYYIEKVEIDDDTKTNYFKFDTYKDGDANLLVSYSDETNQIVPVTCDMVNIFNTNEVGESSVKLTYLDHYILNYPIKVKLGKVKDIQISEDTQLEYSKNEEFAGVKFEVTYENDGKEVISYDALDKVEGFATDEIGNKTVSFEFGGFKKSFNITVIHTITDFEIKNIKKLYDLGEVPKDLQYVNISEDGTKEDGDVITNVAELFDTSTYGHKEVEISYHGMNKKYIYDVAFINTPHFDKYENHRFVFDFFNEHKNNPSFVDYSKWNFVKSGGVLVPNTPAMFEDGVKSQVATSVNGIPRSGRIIAGCSVPNNKMVISLYSAFAGKMDIYLTTQSCTNKGNDDQDLGKVMGVKVNDIVSDLNGVIAAHAGTGSWKNMTNWTDAKIATDVDLKLGLNTIEITAASNLVLGATVRFPNMANLFIDVRK